MRESTPPAGLFQTVHGGAAMACGLDDTGAIRCWGQTGYTNPVPAWSAKHLSVSAGSQVTCLVKTGGVAACRGKGPAVPS